MLSSDSAAQFHFVNLEATIQFGFKLGQMLNSGDVIALNGDLAAGKTTLTQAIARGLGITSDVTSPTFTLIHEYPGRIPMFHIDPYRLTNPNDVYDLGLEDYFARNGVVVVEWAEKLRDILPSELLDISIELPLEIENEQSRRVLLRGVGVRYSALIKNISVVLQDESQGINDEAAR